MSKFQLIPSTAHLTTQWSGGTTTQLFISPEDATVADRDFDFRISSAKVEVNESTFTPFVGYHRTLLILDGRIHISHEGHHKIVLNQFDQDFFKGDWNTTSIGTCVDFNVISKSNYTNTTEAFSILKGENVRSEYSNDWLFVYVFKGEIKIIRNEGDLVLNQGAFLVITAVEKENLEIVATEDSEVVIVQLSKKETKV
jgi:environmental stress-induced protein Ves